MSFQYCYCSKTIAVLLILGCIFTKVQLWYIEILNITNKFNIYRRNWTDNRKIKMWYSENHNVWHQIVQRALMTTKSSTFYYFIRLQHTTLIPEVQPLIIGVLFVYFLTICVHHVTKAVVKHEQKLWWGKQDRI